MQIAFNCILRNCQIKWLSPGVYVELLGKMYLQIALCPLHTPEVLEDQQATVPWDCLYLGLGIVLGFSSSLL